MWLVQSNSNARKTLLLCLNGKPMFDFLCGQGGCLEGLFFLTSEGFRKFNECKKRANVWSQTIALKVVQDLLKPL